MKQISDKRRKQQKIWNKIVAARAEELNNLCEFCGRYGKLKDSSNPLIGHHKIRRRGPEEDTPENVYVCHYLCHQYIHNHRDVENSIRGKI